MLAQCLVMALDRQNQMARFRISTEELMTRTLPDEGCMQQCLPVEVGLGYSKTYRLDPEMSYIETRYRPAKKLAVLSQTETDEPRMVVTFGLEGNSRFLNDDGRELIFKPGYAAITTFAASKGERQYEADDCSVQLRISLSRTGLTNLFGGSCGNGLFNLPNMQLLSCRPMSSYSAMAIRQLTACKLAPEVKLAFLRGIAISALAVELSPLLAGCDGEVVFSRRDQAKAILARDILLREFRTPPSVAQLAKRVATNQFNLKQLFRCCFNTTPYGLLLEIRMEHARQLLASGQYHVNTVADRVGYRHASNFSAAFSKYYGISPKHFAGRRLSEAASPGFDQQRF